MAIAWSTARHSTVAYKGGVKLGNSGTAWYEVTKPGQGHAASLRLTTHHQPVNQGDQRSCQQDQGPTQVHPGDQRQANSGA